MRRTSGFTVIELISAVVLVIIVGTLVILQKNNLDAGARDQQRKTAVNAIYYGLKQGYFTQNNSYPSEISAATLPYVDPKSFEPVNNNPEYTIRYRGFDCDNAKCANFEVKTNLEKEATYIKKTD